MFSLIRRLIAFRRAGLPVGHVIVTVVEFLDPALKAPLDALLSPANEQAVEAILARLEADLPAAPPPPAGPS